MRKLLRQSLALIAVSLAALMSPCFVAAALLIAGIALVAEAVRMLAGTAYALLVWGLASVLVSILIARGVARGA